MAVASVCEAWTGMSTVWTLRHVFLGFVLLYNLYLEERQSWQDCCEQYYKIKQL